MDQSEREQYLAWSRLPVFARRVERARETISLALDRAETWYVAFSGGKDSEVVLHLVMQERPGIYAAFADSGAEYEDTYRFVSLVEREWPATLARLRPAYSILELREMSGSLGGGDGQTVRLAKGEYTRRLIHEPMEAFAQAIDAQGYYLGLRSDESNAREISMATTGRLAQLKNGLWRCCPIADWTQKDVWAYIVSNELPYNAAYDKGHDVLPREEIRVTPYAGTTGVSRGRYVWLRQAYPETWAKYASAFPQVRAYS